MYSKTISGLIFYLFIYLFFFWGGGEGGGGRLFEAERLLTFLPIGWALIRGWALNRINTVCEVLKILKIKLTQSSRIHHLSTYAKLTNHFHEPDFLHSSPSINSFN